MDAKSSRMKESLEGMKGRVLCFTVWTDYRAVCWRGTPVKVGQLASNDIMRLSLICK